MTQSTRLYVHGTGKNQRSTARQLIATAQTPTQRSLDETVELYSAEDIIESDTLPGLFCVRSKFSAHRYYTCYAGECSCGKANCSHIRQAAAAQQKGLAAA